MTAICLAMIVKDEAHVIARAIASVRPFIDSYAIVDTGSTDDTKAIATNALHPPRRRGGRRLLPHRRR